MYNKILLSSNKWLFIIEYNTVLVAGVAGSNPSEGMDVCLLCLYVVLSCAGRGLCDGMITRPEESYRVSVCVW
jgi:hypothetical protein